MIYDVNVNADYTADRGDIADRADIAEFWIAWIVQFSSLPFVVCRAFSIEPPLSSFDEHGQTVRDMNKSQKHKNSK